MKTILLKGMREIMRQAMRLGLALLLAFGISAFAATLVLAKGLSETEKMARKAQDPLANMKAVILDNSIGFGASEDEDAYAFLIQPVYAIFTNLGLTVIPRAVIPIVRPPAGSVLPRLGPEQRPESGREWGLSDILGQLFFAPSGGEGQLKWGAGLQFSFTFLFFCRASDYYWEV